MSNLKNKLYQYQHLIAMVDALNWFKFYLERQMKKNLEGICCWVVIYQILKFVRVDLRDAFVQWIDTDWNKYYYENDIEN